MHILIQALARKLIEAMNALAHLFTLECGHEQTLRLHCRHYGGDVRAAISVDDTLETGQNEGYDHFRIRGRVKANFLFELSSLIDRVLRIRFVSIHKTDEIVENFYTSLKKSLLFVRENPEDAED